MYLTMSRDGNHQCNNIDDNKKVFYWITTFLHAQNVLAIKMASFIVIWSTKTRQNYFFLNFHAACSIERKERKKETVKWWKLFNKKCFEHLSLDITQSERRKKSFFFLLYVVAPLLCAWHYIFYAFALPLVSLCDKQFAKTYFHRWYRKFMFLFICYVIEKGNKFMLCTYVVWETTNRLEDEAVSFSFCVHKINNSFADRKSSPSLSALAFCCLDKKTFA